MERFNLWVVSPDHAKVICYGQQCEMNDLALTAGLPGDVPVLPDGDEPTPHHFPIQPQALPCQKEV
jgi:hypothetical protein